MRSFFVVVYTPSLQLFGRIFKPHEPMSVQTFCTEPAVEGLDIGIVGTSIFDLFCVFFVLWFEGRVIPLIPKPVVPRLS